jgi:MFS family permease
MELHGRLGALAERNFRLVFSSTTISALGDGVTTIALAFAVLHISHNSATAVGLVIAARQASSAAITVAAGVWADRLPRHLVLVAAASVQGAVQAIAGTLIVTGDARVWMLVILGFVFGLADGFVIPTSQGLIPAVVSATRLQQANALLGLSRSLLGVLGPALGAVLVAAGSPGGALLVDAGSFGVAALLLRRVMIPARADHVEPEPFFKELREGWNAFRRQTWIWTTIVFFGIGNCASTSLFVLGPLVMKRHYDGATTWGILTACFSAGTILGGLFALRYRPGRPLLASCVAATPLLLQPFAIALRLPVGVLVAIAVVAGIGLAIHLALWFTTFQRNVPAEALSRVSSYDALGSFVLMPLGSAIAGPVSALVGVTQTLIGTSVIEAVCFAVIIAQPSVWAIREHPAPSQGEIAQEAA